jgi:hypothetical protein
MQCQECLSLLSDYIDKQLEADIAREIEIHTAACSECRQEWTALSGTVRLMKNLPRFSAPDSVAKDISKALQKQENQRARLRAGFHGLFALAASLLVVMILSYTNENFKMESPTVAEHSAPVEATMAKKEQMEAKKYQEYDMKNGHPFHEEAESPPSDPMPENEAAAGDVEALDDFSAGEEKDLQRMARAEKADARKNNHRRIEDAINPKRNFPVTENKKPSESDTGVSLEKTKLEQENSVAAAKDKKTEEKQAAVTAKETKPEPVAEEQKEIVVAKGPESDAGPCDLAKWYPDISQKVGKETPIVVRYHILQDRQDFMAVLGIVTLDMETTSKKLATIFRQPSSKIEFEWKEKTISGHFWNQPVEYTELFSLFRQLQEFCRMETGTEFSYPKDRKIQLTILLLNPLD